MPSVPADRDRRRSFFDRRASLAAFLSAAILACGSESPTANPSPSESDAALPHTEAGATSTPGDRHPVTLPDPETGPIDPTPSDDASFPAEQPDASSGSSLSDAAQDLALDARIESHPDAQAADRGGAFDAAAIKALMSKVAQYQLTLYNNGASSDWIDSTFYAGLMAAYRTTSEATLLSAAKSWAQRSNWAVHAASNGNRFADNQTCTQTYLELYELAPSAANTFMVDKARAVFDSMVAAPRAGRDEWYWADSLFMAPPAFARAGAILNQPHYTDLMHKMFVDTTQYLFSPTYNLVYRDKKYFNGDTFWSRGNGWVVAGTVRVLDYLAPNDDRRAFYNSLLVTMSGALAKAQGSDGLWRTSLLHPEAVNLTGPETSGSGFFTYAMAWGINHGVLPRDVYLPIVTRGWNGLVRNVNAQGRLGYVQRVGEAPNAAAADETHPYGVGAFLLAGSEVIKL